MTNKEKNSTKVAVIGALGYTGRFVIADLLRRGITPIAIARNADALKSAELDSRVIRREASVENSQSLDCALEGSSVVINLAGPFIDTAEPVANAALRAGIHYIDVAAEQLSTAALYETFDARAKESGVVIIPSMAFFGGLSDLLTTTLMGDWDRADLVETYIGFDIWHPTQGSRNTIGRKTVGNTILVDGQLKQSTGEPAKKDWQFAAPIGDRAVLEIPFSEVVVIARHIKTTEHHNFITEVAVTEVLDPGTPFPKAVDSMGRSAQNFVLDVVVSREGVQRRGFMRGRDGYAVTAPMTGEAVERLLSGRFHATGARAPGEVFDAEDLLRALGPDHAVLEIVSR